MSAATERFTAFLQLSDQILSRAERDDLEECARILAVQCAHYRSKFGELPMSETMDVLASETMNDGQAKVDRGRTGDGCGCSEDAGGGAFETLKHGKADAAACICALRKSAERSAFLIGAARPQLSSISYVAHGSQFSDASPRPKKSPACRGLRLPGVGLQGFIQGRKDEPESDAIICQYPRAICALSHITRWISSLGLGQVAMLGDANATNKELFPND